MAMFFVIANSPLVRVITELAGKAKEMVSPFCAFTSA